MSHRAGFWIRTLATAIDATAMLVLALIVAIAVQVTAPSAGDWAIWAVVYGVWLAYTTCEIWTAATPGKMLLRLRVTEQDDSPAAFWRRVLRWSTKYYWLKASLLFALTGSPVFYALSGLCSGFTLVGCLFAANDDGLTWHDAWAHSAVCHWPRPSRPLVPPPLPPPARSPAASPPQPPPPTA